jgi:hypothetical protein
LITLPPRRAPACYAGTGLAFVGPLASIGLSLVRESAVFSGIAIAERPVAERCCFVRVVACVKFEDAM